MLSPSACTGTGTGTGLSSCGQLQLLLLRNVSQHSSSSGRSAPGACFLHGCPVSSIVLSKATTLRTAAVCVCLFLSLSLFVDVICAAATYASEFCPGIPAISNESNRLMLTDAFRCWPSTSLPSLCVLLGRGVGAFLLPNCCCWRRVYFILYQYT